MTNIFPVKAAIAIIQIAILKDICAKMFSQLEVESKSGTGEHAVIFAGTMQQRYTRVEALVNVMNDRYDRI